MTSIKEFQTASGLSVPVIGLGTWGMGGHMQRDPTHDDTRDIQAIQFALAHGIRHIDTAEIYAQGHTEEMVGRAIQTVPRENLFLASKVAGAHLAADDVRRAFDQTCQRLKTDYLDLYYVHVPNKEVPLAETAKAFNKLLAEGRIRGVGVCNFAVATMKEFQSFLEAPIAVNQSHYNLIYREPERTGLLEHCRAAGAAFIAWRPVLWRHEGRADQPPGSAWDRSVYPLLDQMAAKYGRSGVQVAMNFLLGQDGVGALVKTSDPSHFGDLIGCLDWSLTPEDREILRRDFPGQRLRSGSVPLQ